MSSESSARLSTDSERFTDRDNKIDIDTNPDGEISGKKVSRWSKLGRGCRKFGKGALATLAVVGVALLALAAVAAVWAAVTVAIAVSHGVAFPVAAPFGAAFTVAIGVAAIAAVTWTCCTSKREDDDSSSYHSSKHTQHHHHHHHCHEKSMLDRLDKWNKGNADRFKEKHGWDPLRRKN